MAISRSECLNTTSSTETTRSRTSDIYHRIRDDIIRGQLAPGLKLKIDGLRNHYDVGATPIREALSLLTADGLVERLEQRGFRVAEMSDAEFDELLALRCWVEERAVCQAIAKGDKEWQEGIVVARFHLSRTPRIPPDLNQPQISNMSTATGLPSKSHRRLRLEHFASSMESTL